MNESSSQSNTGDIMTNHDCSHPLLIYNQYSTYGSHPRTTDAWNNSNQSCQQPRMVLQSKPFSRCTFRFLLQSTNKIYFGATSHLLVMSTPIVLLEVSFREQHKVHSIHETVWFDHEKYASLSHEGDAGDYFFHWTQTIHLLYTIRDFPGTNDNTIKK